MLDEQTKIIISKSRHYTRWIIITILVLFPAIFLFSFLLAAGIELKIISILEIPIVFTMLVILFLEAAIMSLAILLARQGGKIQNNYLLVTGLILIIGGIWLDVLATIANTPSLEREGNFFIIALREFNLPVAVMYIIGFVAQLGITVISCCIWVAFLRHAESYKKLVWEIGPKNLLQFLYVSFGGNLKTTKAHSQKNLLSRSYRIFWIIGLWNIVPFTRWLLGFEWMGMVETGAWQGTVMILEKVFVAACYFGWLIYSYYFHDGQPAPRDGSKTESLSTANAILDSEEK